MNTVNIFIKQIKHNIRDFKGMALMVLFPIVLILVLGTALPGFFDSSASFRDIKVIYTSQANRPLSLAFQGFVEKGRDMGMEFTAAESPGQGLEAVKNGKYVCFIAVKENGIELYQNSSSFKAHLVEALLETFLQRYSAAGAIARVSPAAAQRMIAGQNTGGSDYVSVSSPGQRQGPGALDYYAVTMLTLIIMYSSLTGASAIKNEKTAGTYSRLLCSPVGKYEILTGKTLGVLAVTLLQALGVILFSRYVFGANWGSHPGTIFLLVAAEVVMAVSLGMGLTFMIKGETTVRSLLNIIIPFMVFLGGGYVPLEGLGNTLLSFSQLSPVRWMNKALFQVIYSQDFGSVLPALCVNLGIAAVFMAVSSLAIRKESF
jgi:ABC-2 type transport system permease protein